VVQAQKYQNVTSFSNEDCLNNLVLKLCNLTFSSAALVPAEESLKLPYENSPVLVAPFFAISKILSICCHRSNHEAKISK
jgi:hypothetical protein